MAVVTSNPPEQGQLVTVRQRQYVVSEVAKSTLTAIPLQPLDGQGQHLVTLASVEDDALGEELQVIWELEPGAAVIEDVSGTVGESAPIYTVDRDSLPEPNHSGGPLAATPQTGRIGVFLSRILWRGIGGTGRDAVPQSILGALADAEVVVGQHR